MAKRIKRKNNNTLETRRFDSRDFNNNVKKPMSREDKKMFGLSMLVLLVVVVIGYLCFGLWCSLVLVGGCAVILLIYKLLMNAMTSKRKKRIINAILIGILTIGIICLVAFSTFLVYIVVSAPKFDPESLNTKEPSIVYDSDNKVIDRLGSERREKVKYEDLPQVLIDAIVATEDSRFYQHNGFDAPRFFKASVLQVLHTSGAGGASTLSMQVVKNSLTDASEDHGIKGIIRKFTDIYLSVFKLEKNYTKEEIVEFYVNNHYLGGRVYGVQEASRTYFNKDVGDLTLAEASIIAGMFKNPTGYSPTANPDGATKRRKTVLYLMKRHGYITEEEEKLANNVPVSSLTRSSDDNQNTSSSNPYQGYIDTVVKEVENKFGVNPYKVSLQIYTNMDRSKQDGINRVFNGESYHWVDDNIQSGVSVLDVQTGKLLAVGAGRHRNAGDWNFAIDNERQPGSTAKPLFDYGPGIEYNNWSTYQQFLDAPYTYTGGRSISNWDKGYMGQMTLRRALALSRNIPALKAFQQVDKSKIIQFVTNLGIEPEIQNGTIHEAHSIGAFSGVNSLQMAAAYSAFANGGYYNEPYAVSKIVYRENGAEKVHKSQKRKAMSDSTAYMIADVLQDVKLNGGGVINNYAVKTGTTNFDDNYVRSHGLPGDAIRDSWAVGFSTKTAVAMWYGYNDIKDGCMRNLPSSIEKDKLYRTLVKEVVESNREAFRMPDSVVKLPVISGSNPAKIAPTGYSGSVTYELFKKNHLPSGSDSNSGEKEVKLDTPGNLKATYSNGTVTLSWTGVSNIHKEYGTFGYNVYFGNTLLGFTESTSFTKSLANPYGTYKVVATYQSYSGINSNPAVFNLKDTSTSTTPDSPSTDTNKISYKISYYCGNTHLEDISKVIQTSADSYLLYENNIPDSSRLATSKCSAEGRIVAPSMPFKITNNSTIRVTYKEKVTP